MFSGSVGSLVLLLGGSTFSRSVEFPESCLWLPGFDIKFVKVRRASRSSKSYRKSSHEHTFIEDMLYSRLYGSVDMSTCIYLDDESLRVRGYLDLAAPGLYKLESHHVRPYDGKTLEGFKLWLQHYMWRTRTPASQGRYEVKGLLRASGGVRPQARCEP